MGGRLAQILADPPYGTLVAGRDGIEIPQKDGTLASFPQSELTVAFINLMERLGAGEDGPPEHPLLGAVRNSSDPEWQQSFFVCEDPDAHTRPDPAFSE